MSCAPSSPPVWDAKHLRLATDAAGVGLWSWNVDTDKFTMDERALDMWGEPGGGSVTFEELSAHIHPKDLDRVRAAFAATRSVVGAYEIDFRIVVDKEERWISARGQGDDAGMIDRVMTGIFLDATQRKQAEEALELLAGEMSHRVKNLLAIASALTTLTSRTAATTTEMARDLTHRLVALGRAHDLVRPVPGQKTRAALLGDLLTVLLAPYDEMGAFRGRIRVSVPRMSVGEAAATTLALVIHELATNALKYGSLSKSNGTLDVSCTTSGGLVVIVWSERGGPAVVPPTKTEGFGRKMAARGMSGQLGGSIEYEWAEAGVVVTLEMKKDRLAT